MPTDKALPGQLMLDLAAASLTPEERELLAHPQVGGVILFSRNYEDPLQLTALVREIRAATPRRLLVAVDHEGGRVQRFQHGFTKLPAMASLGAYFDQQSEPALSLAQTTGWLMAAELLSFDIDLSFAPVLDIDYGMSEVMATRSFHHQASAVIALAQAFCQGMQQAGMAAVGKHFPGHGGVSADSHHAIPIDNRSLAELTADIQVFAQLIAQGLAGIMPAHIIYSQLAELPAGFSSFWLQTQLRQKLNFQGVIFSDDLGMVGASGMGDYPARAQAALSAGCDMILVCNQRQGAIAILDALGTDCQLASQLRIKALLAPQRQPILSELQQQSLWQQAHHAIATFLTQL